MKQLKTITACDTETFDKLVNELLYQGYSLESTHTSTRVYSNDEFTGDTSFDSEILYTAILSIEK